MEHLKIKVFFFHFEIKLFIYVLLCSAYKLLKEKKFSLIRTPLSHCQQNNQYYQGQYEVRYGHDRRIRNLNT
jgi:hypothetical protein